MDYSILLGIHTIPNEKDESPRSSSGSLRDKRQRGISQLWRMPEKIAETIVDSVRLKGKEKGESAEVIRESARTDIEVGSIVSLPNSPGTLPTAEPLSLPSSLGSLEYNRESAGT